MHSKEKVNCKQNRLFDTSFFQNDKEKPSDFVFYSDQNNSALVFAALFDVVVTKKGQI